MGNEHPEGEPHKLSDEFMPSVVVPGDFSNEPNLTRLRNAYLRILLADAAAALRRAQATASWLCTEENMELLATIDRALDAGPG